MKNKVARARVPRYRNIHMAIVCESVRGIGSHRFDALGATHTFLCVQCFINFCIARGARNIFGRCVDWCCRWLQVLQNKQYVCFYAFYFFELKVTHTHISVCMKLCKCQRCGTALWSTHTYITNTFHSLLPLLKVMGEKRDKANEFYTWKQCNEKLMWPLILCAGIITIFASHTNMIEMVHERLEMTLECMWQFLRFVPRKVEEILN